MWNRCWLPTGCLFVLSWWMASHAASAAEPGPRGPWPNAHAHNDYAHARPLLDALDQGFTSVEADIFLVNGKLLVGHHVLELRPARTLEALYLQPLAARIQTRNGHVYGPEIPFTLMIDLKTAAEPTYAALDAALAPYREWLTSVEGNEVRRGAVTVVLSGNRPVETVSRAAQRWVSLDGRPADLDSTAPPHLIPWISDSWSGHFRWNGRGEMPAEERAKLRSLVERTHQRGSKLRFWGAPDRPETWGTLLDAGVDLINTDRLADLSEFLQRRS